MTEIPMDPPGIPGGPGSGPGTLSGPPAGGGGPGAPDEILVAFAEPAEQRRLTVLVRIILAIPHLVVLYILSIASEVVALVCWLTVREPPRGGSKESAGEETPSLREAIREFMGKASFWQIALATGKQDVIRCPYHSWLYRLNGALAGASALGDTPGFDKAGHGLVPVATTVPALW